MNYEGKTVWITGASSGIGAAMCKELSSKGANLVLSARRESELEAVRLACERPDSHLCLPLDVTRETAVQAAFQAILDRFGALHSIILNAGIGQRGSVVETTLQTERDIMEVNYFSVVAMTRTVLPHFLGNNEGQIVVISSVMGWVATPRRATYAASKHALQGYFEALRAELYQTNVSISIVCPGYIRTQISTFSVTGDGKPFGKMDKQHRNAMTADVFARKAIRKLERNKPIMFIGGPERFAPLLARISPGILRFFLPRLIKRD